MSWYGFRPYVPVATRRAQAAEAMEKLRKKGKKISPVEISGRTIARSFWGKQWCTHMESFHDYTNRLERGRRYVRNGSVCHLEIRAGEIRAIVSGSDLYHVHVEIDPLDHRTWDDIVCRCGGRIGSMLELLQGRFSDEVMAVVIRKDKGLLPRPGQIDFSCDCPDGAHMCKHVAAVFYGIGSRLDDHPELLFLLRKVDAEELIAAEPVLSDSGPSDDVLGDDQLEDIFGIELDNDAAPAAAPSSKTRKGRTSAAHGRRNGRARKAKRGKKDSGRSTRAKSKDRGKRLPPFSPTGPEIRALREAYGLTVAEFAELARVSPASVSRWESINGPVNLHTRNLTALTLLHRNAPASRR